MKIFSPFVVRSLRSTRAMSTRAPVKKPTSQLGILGYEGEEIPRFYTMTKIVATVGPASDVPGVVSDFVNEGMNIMRMNFSHATYDEALMRKNRLRESEGREPAGSFLDENGVVQSVANTKAVMLDTKGPEIRTGRYKNKKELKLAEKERIIVTNHSKYFEYDIEVKNDYDKKIIYVDYKRLCDTLVPGDTILLNDGALGLTVKSLKKDEGFEELVCEVQNDGVLGNKKGVNLPGKIVDMPGITEKDKEDLRWGIENDVDFIAQSFVRKASDVLDCKNFMDSVIEEMIKKDPNSPVASPHYYPPKVIAKIESAEALENFDEILAVSDGIMVARGDLGVEIPLRKVTLAQKIMIRKCNEVGKPVIVATQMLESMQQSPRPTRAEVSDVTNAVYDGCDAVMLSGESANGKFPLQSVQTMRRIIRESDQYMNYFAQQDIESTGSYKPKFGSSQQAQNQHLWTQKVHSSQSIDISGSLGSSDALQRSKARQEATCAAAVEAASCIDAKLIIVLVRGGTAARLCAKFRPRQPVMAFCLHPKTARQLQIHRGVYPVVGKGEIVDTDDSHQSPFRRFRHRHVDSKEAIEAAKKLGWIQPGDAVVTVNATPGDKTFTSSLGVNVIEVM